MDTALGTGSVAEKKMVDAVHLALVAQPPGGCDIIDGMEYEVRSGV